MKPVAWPPKRGQHIHESGHEIEGHHHQVQQQHRYSVASCKVAPPKPPKPGVRDEAHATQVRRRLTSHQMRRIISADSCAWHLSHGELVIMRAALYVGVSGVVH